MSPYAPLKGHSTNLMQKLQLTGEEVVLSVGKWSYVLEGVFQSLKK